MILPGKYRGSNLILCSQNQPLPFQSFFFYTAIFLFIIEWPMFKDNIFGSGISAITICGGFHDSHWAAVRPSTPLYAKSPNRKVCRWVVHICHNLPACAVGFKLPPSSSNFPLMLPRQNRILSRSPVPVSDFDLRQKSQYPLLSLFLM